MCSDENKFENLSKAFQQEEWPPGGVSINLERSQDQFCRYPQHEAKHGQVNATSCLDLGTTVPHYLSAELSLKLGFASSEKGSQDAQTALTYSKQFTELNDP